MWNRAAVSKYTLEYTHAEVCAHLLARKSTQCLYAGYSQRLRLYFLPYFRTMRIFLYLYFTKFANRSIFWYDNNYFKIHTKFLKVGCPWGWRLKAGFWTFRLIIICDYTIHNERIAILNIILHISHNIAKVFLQFLYLIFYCPYCVFQHQLQPLNPL